MKRFNVLLLFIALVAQVQAQKTETRELASFDKLNVFGDIKVELIKSDDEKVELIVEGADLENVVTEVRGKTLKIKMKSEIFTEKEVNIKLYYKNISEIQVAASAIIRSTEEIKTDRLDIRSSSGANIELNIDVYALDIKANQGGVINLKGKSKTQNVESNTGGIYDAFDLISEDAIVKAGTGGLAKVHSTNLIDAFASSGSTITYMGDPKIQHRKSNLGGKIINQDESR